MASEVRPSNSSVWAIAVGGGGLAMSMLPVFLTGALGVHLTEELQFGSLGLGAAIATHRLASAPAAIFGGRLADRLGASLSLRLAAAAAGLACVGIALTARSWFTLAIWLAVAGLSLTLADPAANRLLVNIVPPHRLGVAFGFKQSATPAATMAAGISVPLVAASLGWRWAFVLAAGACVLVILAVGRAPRRTPRAKSPGSRPRLRDPATIVLLSAALGFNTASSSTVPSFFVTSSVDAGSAATLAGTILAVASIATIAVRMIAGVLADRMSAGHLRLCVAGQLTGSIGMLMLASSRPVLVALGGILALAGTWGFHGVFWFTMVRSYPETPGAITGAVAPGALLGGVAGPLLFGAIAGDHGFRAGWIFAAVLAMGAAASTQLGVRRLAGVSQPR